MSTGAFSSRTREAAAFGEIGAAQMSKNFLDRHAQ
jgi:hypothetical protein